MGREVCCSGGDNSTQAHGCLSQGSYTHSVSLILYSQWHVRSQARVPLVMTTTVAHKQRRNISHQSLLHSQKRILGPFHWLRPVFELIYEPYDDDKQTYAMRASERTC